MGNLGRKQECNRWLRRYNSGTVDYYLRPRRSASHRHREVLARTGTTGAREGDGAAGRVAAGGVVAVGVRVEGTRFAGTALRRTTKRTNLNATVPIALAVIAGLTGISVAIVL